MEVRTKEGEVGSKRKSDVFSSPNKLRDGTKLSGAFRGKEKREKGVSYSRCNEAK